MVANPKPEESFRAFFGERAVVESNSRRIKGTDLLQMNGWVTRIGFDEREIFVGKSANAFGKPAVMKPEIWIGKVIQSGVWRPAL